MLAMQYVLDRQRDQADLESLILCGSPASMTRWVSDCTELLAEETEQTRRVIREHEAAGFTGCRLPEIGVRTLLVGGRYDECTPGHLEEMHRRIAGSQLVIIEDASHLCFAEQPEEFNRVINSFMT
jgi:pimeloyl-ACP methyl ester carboxylesterase